MKNTNIAHLKRKPYMKMPHTLVHAVKHAYSTCQDSAENSKLYLISCRLLWWVCTFNRPTSILHDFFSTFSSWSLISTHAWMAEVPGLGTVGRGKLWNIKNDLLVAQVVNVILSCVAFLVKIHNDSMISLIVFRPISRKCKCVF